MSETTILQVLPELRSGGVERGTIEIARAIKERGWKSLVVSGGGPLVDKLVYAGGEHIALPVHRKNLITMVKNITRLSDIIRSRNVSIIHARSRVPAWSAYYAAKRCHIPFVTTFHGVYNLHGFGKQTYNSIMTRGAKVIAVSEFIRDHILAHYPGCPAQRIEVIHRGADISAFHPNAITPGILGDLAGKWRISDNHAPVILMPGRMTRWKGQHVLVEALAKIKDRDFLALFLGDATGHPAYAQEIEMLINRYDLAGKVRFVGATNHMTEAYALSDIVVVPSIEPEAFGRVPVEGQAMGKIVIATDHGGARETIDPSRTGFLVTPNDAGELSRMLERVLDMSPATRNEIGSVAMAHVDQYFSIEKMQQKTMSVYETLL